MRRTLGLLAACAFACTAQAGWVNIGWSATPGATGIRSGCVSPGQYERPLVAIAGAAAGSATIGGLPDTGKCYFALNAGPQDEWVADFSALKFGQAVPGAADFTVAWSPTPAAVSITNLSPASYRVGTLAVGATVYRDRVYTWSDVGALGGSQYVQTANDDKLATTAPSFSVSGPATVYVAYDARFAAPSWLSAWTNTGQSLGLSDGSKLRLHRRDFQAGPVALGPNSTGSTASSMFSVIVVPR